MNLERGDDGLLVRPYKIHSYLKPMLLRYYLRPFTLILSKRFPRFCYLDGFSGPGSVRIKIGQKSYELPGSPLTALQAKPGFTDYFFCDSNKDCVGSLQMRCEKMGIANRNINVLPAQDFNLCAPSLISQIPMSYHLFAFLDPDGLELRWDTVGSIGARKHREILLNFSNGVYRCAKASKTNPGLRDTLNKFMGSEGEWWRYSSEEILQTYKTNLKALGTGFKYIMDLPVRNQTQSIVYHLLFATDNDTAFKIIHPRIARLESLGSNELMTIFLKEQGENIPTLDDFGQDRRQKDAAQTALAKYLR